MPLAERLGMVRNTLKAVKRNLVKGECSGMGRDG